MLIKRDLCTCFNILLNILLQNMMCNMSRNKVLSSHLFLHFKRTPYAIIFHLINFSNHLFHIINPFQYYFCLHRFKSNSFLHANMRTGGPYFRRALSISCATFQLSFFACFRHELCRFDVSNIYCRTFRNAGLRFYSNYNNIAYQY